MSKINLLNSFKEFCKKNKFEINFSQIKVIVELDKFLNSKKTIFNSILHKNNKLCFYLFGSVGVGKTMILNFAYDQLNINKLRLHFNEFMINFHDFKHNNAKEEGNSVSSICKKSKKKI